MGQVGFYCCPSPLICFPFFLPFFHFFLPLFLSILLFTFSSLFLSPFVFSSLFSLPSSLLYQHIFPYTVYHSLLPLILPFSLLFPYYLYLPLGFTFSLLPLSFSRSPIFLRCSSLCALICIFHTSFIRLPLRNFLWQLPQCAHCTIMHH